MPKQPLLPIRWITSIAALVIAIALLWPRPQGSVSTDQSNRSPEAPSSTDPTIPPDATPQTGEALPGALRLVRTALESIQTSPHPEIDMGAEEEARRRDWMATFPLQPTYSSEFLHEEMDPVDPMEPMLPYDAERDARQARVARHGFLSNFYQHPWRESAAFQAYYGVMESEGLLGDTVSLASVFHDLVDYTIAQTHEPETPMTKTSWGVDPATGRETKTAIPITDSAGNTKTWQWAQETLQDSLVAWITDPDAWPEGQRAFTDDEALELLGRLQTEVSADTLIQLDASHSIGFTFDASEEDELNAGDRLLIN